MSAREAPVVLAELRRRGVEVVADGDHVAFRPAAVVGAELRARIRRCKSELLELLRGPVERSEWQPTLPCRCCGSRRYWALASVGYWTCAGCHAPDQAPEQLVWIAVSAVEPLAASTTRPRAMCLSCGGVRFVRLSNGRRSVCVDCEHPNPRQIAGDDAGVIDDSASEAEDA